MKQTIVAKLDKINDEKALQQVIDILSEKDKQGGYIDILKYKDYIFEKHDGLLKRLS